MTPMWGIFRSAFAVLVRLHERWAWWDSYLCSGPKPHGACGEPSFVSSGLFGRTFGLRPIRVGHLTGDEHRLAPPIRARS